MNNLLSTREKKTLKFILLKKLKHLNTKSVFNKEYLHATEIRFPNTCHLCNKHYQFAGSPLF